MWCKHTVSECVTDNGDPPVVRKKARDAAKKILLTFHSNQALLTLTKIVFSLKPFLKKHPKSLKGLMEVMMMRMMNL